AAIEQRALRRAAAVANMRANALDHEARFVDLVVSGIQVDDFAGAVGGPQVFSESFGVVRDYRVGGGEDIAAGAVVLFQPYGLRAGVIAQEALHVLDPGANHTAGTELPLQ